MKHRVPRGARAIVSLISILFIAGVMLPAVARASVLNTITSIFKGKTTYADATANAANVQTMALLTPAMNLDPAPYRGGAELTIDNGALVPSSGPLGTFEEAGRAGGGLISLHVVRPGETLSEIAATYDVSINTIVWANNIKARYIYPGQELTILPVTGVRHKVVNGDTLASIARKYNGTLEETALYNELNADASLAVGQIVVVPNGVVAPPPAPAPTRRASAPAPSVAVQSSAVVGNYMAPLATYQRTQGVHGYNGVDLAAARGTPVMASAGGTVEIASAGGWNGGYGSYIVIQHPGGSQTLYAHLSRVSVSRGQSVVQGQIIGYVGSTGRSTGPHLHFEIRGGPRNPF